MTIIRLLPTIAGVVCLLLGVTGCSKTPDDENFLESETAKINGLQVQWRAYMTNEQRQVISDILSDMVLVEGGIFTMGATQDFDVDARVNESPAHLVKLTDFYICAHELTYEQIQTLMPTTRSSDIHEFEGKYLYYSWEDWNNVLRLLTDFTSIEFTFPSEAQWEFAARGGNLSKGYRYPGSNKWEDVYADDLNDTDDTVPNELMLYNMANRRSEWCADAYADYTDGPMPTNPLVTIGDGHVVRGGCHVSVSVSKNWSSILTSSTTYIEVYEDQRMSRPTARARHSSRSWDISCRPVINIKTDQ